MRLGYIGISGRNDIPRHLTESELLGVGVEIGTHKGEFAGHILRNWEGRHLYCVDPYENAPNYTTADNAMEEDRGPHKRAALTTLMIDGPKRSTLFEMTSAQAASHFNPHLPILPGLDFVYIDGNHRVDAVFEDLSLWWPKIKPGGLLMGHDYICPGEIDGGWGKHVQEAITAFCEEIEDQTNLEMIVCPIPEVGGLPWSFAIRKFYP